MKDGGNGQCTGGDFLCSRDLDGHYPHMSPQGSGVFCFHYATCSFIANTGLGSLHRNLYDHDISNPFAFYLAGDYELKIR